MRSLPKTVPAGPERAERIAGRTKTLEKGVETMLPLPLLDEWVKRALAEDLGTGDVTTDALVPSDRWGRAEIVAKESFVVAGMPVALGVFRILSENVNAAERISEGNNVKIGEVLAELEGPLHVLLKGERVALNVLQHLSGVATFTKRFVDAVDGTGVKILDTRKTLPGMRVLEKYAVRVGGGTNHRSTLSEGVLIKENHILACGGIRTAVDAIRRNLPYLLRVEVEASTIEEVEEAVEAGADRILLDNMAMEVIRESVKRVGGRIPLEVSGSVALENVRSIAETGVDGISVGRITHSAPGVDISLLVRDAWAKATE